MHAIEHVNNLRQMLPPEGLEYSMPLELYAGGRVNIRRLCMSFRARRGAELPLDMPCLYDDTVLASLEASAEKNGAAAAEDTSLLESAATAQQEVPSREGNHNAELDFLLLSLRGGNQEAAAHLLGNDSGPCKHTYWPCIPTKKYQQSTGNKFHACFAFVRRVGSTVYD